MEKEVFSDSNAPEQGKLKATLSFPVILLITINSIMGTGIYFLTAVGTRYAGPASIISWILLSILSIYIAMCFAELASMFPKSGGVFEYTKQGFGRMPSFFVGWLAIITSNITLAMLVVGAMQYLMPDQAIWIKAVIALSFVLVFHFITIFGIDLSAKVLTAFATATIGTFLVIIAFGLPQTNPANFSPFFPVALGGLSSVFVAIFFIAETFFGWESTTFLAEETKNAEKVIPKALIWGTVSIAVISLLLVVVSIGNINWEVYGASSKPLIDLAISIFGEKGVGIVKVVIGMTILGSAACWIVAAPRLIQALTKDKLFLLHFKAIHPKYGTPYKAIILQAVIACLMIFAGLGQYEKLLHLLIPLVLFVYCTVILSVAVLRFKRPELPRPYKAPFGTVGPFLVVGVFIALIVMWIMKIESAWPDLRFGLSLVGVGIPLYLLIEMYYNPEMIKEVDDITAHFNMIFEKAILPSHIKKDILTFLGDIKGTRLLDFGCGSGQLATSISRHIGPTGRIIAIDHSHYKLKIIEKNLERAERDEYSQLYSHITTIHDPNLLTQIHPDVPEVDNIVAVNTLSILQDARRVISGLSSILKEDGKICFVEPVDYFWGLIPNTHWLNRDELRKIFYENDFSIQIEKRKHLFWNYIYIYGVKSKAHDVYI